MKYASYDGKLFDSEKECLEHENELNAAKEKEKKLAEEKKRRYEEMVAKCRDAYECINKYNKDYCTHYTLI